MDRADETAHALEQRLAGSRTRMPAVALLLVETRLWSRYVPAGARGARGGGVRIDHGTGPADGDVAIVTGEPVLRALLDGRLGWQRAVDAGLIVVTGVPEARDRIAMELAMRFNVPGATAMLGTRGPGF
jgi:hypothetical protein